MKRILGDFITAFLLGFLLPSVIMGVLVWNLEGKMEVRAVGETLPQTQPVSAVIPEENLISQLQGMEAYLVGVVLAEMPAEFEPEALKAQAVAARTYTQKARETGGKHGDGSVCKDPACCQAYIEPEAYLEQGGTREGLNKISAAVAATSGLVLTYGGELIEATYFSCSGGKTEAAVAVWGTDYPYLKSVDSPGEENAAYFRDTVCFAPEEFANLLGFTPDGPPESWFTLTEYTAGGSVSTMVIGGQQFSGTELRTMLGLRSAAFSVEVVQGTIRFVTQGWGHRVGMSQYGAEAMAAQGDSFADILSHYYPGTELTPWQMQQSEP